MSRESARLPTRCQKRCARCGRPPVRREPKTTSAAPRSIGSISAYNTTLTDIETGYKAFRTDVLRSLHLTEDGFGIEPELTGEICRRGLRVYEVPIAYYGRSYAEGKKITWRDGVTAIGVLVRVRLRR